MVTKMSNPVWVTARRCRDLSSVGHGKLMQHTFRFHRKRVRVDWFDGEVSRKFPNWATAQKAVTELRNGNGTVWDTANLPD